MKNYFIKCGWKYNKYKRYSNNFPIFRIWLKWNKDKIKSIFD